MLNDLTRKKDAESFSVSPENKTGEKGKGGMAEIGEGRRVYFLFFVFS